MEKDLINDSDLITIANFAGFTFEKNVGWYDNEMRMPQIVYDNQNGNCFDKLLFDKDYNWLTPIMEKIETLFSLEKDGYYYSTAINYHSSESTDYDNDDHPYWKQQEAYLDGKIESITEEEPKIYKSGYSIGINKIGKYSVNRGLIASGSSENKLEAVYKAVIEFIKWYNEIK